MFFPGVSFCVFSLALRLHGDGEVVYLPQELQDRAWPSASKVGIQVVFSGAFGSMSPI